MGFDYFRDTILKTLGIDYQYEEIGPTELVELAIHSLYMDFTFLTTGGFYIHTEFQTTDKKEADLRRFHAYDAVYSNKTGKQVVTYYNDFTQLSTACLLPPLRSLPSRISAPGADGCNS